MHNFILIFQIYYEIQNIYNIKVCFRVCKILNFPIPIRTKVKNLRSKYGRILEYENENYTPMLFSVLNLKKKQDELFRIYRMTENIILRDRNNYNEVN